MTEKNLLNEEIKRVKTFMRSMNLFDLTLKEKQNFLEDKRLSQPEKIILESSILLKDCDFKTVIEKLIGLKTQNKLVESQRCFILGMAYNNSGMSEKAVSFYDRAVEILAEHNLARYEFNALLQLFFAHLNLKNKKALGSILDRMQEIVNSDVKERISFLRCRFNYHVIMEEYKAAGAQLKALEKLKDQMHPSQRIFHLIDKFIYYLKIDEYKACELVLKEMKSSRRYSVSANYRFMKAMLAYIMHQAPIYLYENDFQDVPILYFQLKVVQSLESGNLVEAQIFWDKLHALNSEVYSTFLDYLGDKCLFSLCLQNFQSRPATNLLVAPSVKKTFQPRERLLLKILTESSVPVRKEDLFFSIWGKELTSKDELVKLSMFVTRFKKKSGLEIKSQMGCYLLVREVIKKIS
jgi:tetratricopeptide (TPR) repeat protein